MDTKLIRELTRIMRSNDLVELAVEQGDLKIKLAKAQHPVQMVSQMTAAAPVAAAPAPIAVPAADEFAGCKQIISPIPGTVYLKPSPDASNFVKVGDVVKTDSVVCLVEAMKVFNEIKAEVGGTIRKMCVEDGQAVEYGTVLFLVG